MANEKISQMSPAGTVDGTEQIPIVQRGNNVQIASGDLFKGISTIQLPSADHTFSGTLESLNDSWTGVNALLVTTDDNTTELYLHTGEQPNTNTNQTGDAWFESGNVASGSADTGQCGFGSGICASGQSGAAYLYSGDSTDGGSTGNTFVLTGNVDSGSGASGFIDISSGVTQAGISGTVVVESGGSALSNSGNVVIKSGIVSGGVGRSGDVTLQTGTSTGTRGAIILDTDVVNLPTGAYIHTGTPDNNSTVVTSDLWIESGSIQTGSDVYSGDAGFGTGTSDSQRSGNAWLYTGNTNTGTSGPVYIQTGNVASGTANSGDIALSTGTSAGGSRGNIVLDAPAINLPFTGTDIGAGGVAAINDAGTKTIVYFTDDASTSIYLVAGPKSLAATTDTGIAYIFSANTTGSHTSGWVGVTSGNTVDGDSGGAEIHSGNTTGAGNSSNTLVYTGEADGTGNTGSVYVQSGISAAGNSGDITLQTGTAGGTRGNIILDAPLVTASIGTSFEIGTQNNGSGNSDGLDVFSGDTGGVYNSGTVSVGSGNALSTGTTGDANLYSGDAAGGSTGQIGLNTGNAGSGNSGRILLQTGTASGTRGNIILDAPAVQQGFATFGPDPASQGVYGIVANGLNIMATNSDNSNVGAWLFSADTTDKDSINCGVGTGNASGGHGTGPAWLYSGNVTDGSGNSGIVFIESGDVVDGRSGDIQIVTGHQSGSGTRGSIILDAPKITAPVGQTLYFASETPTDTTASGDVGMESADTQVSGGNSGGAFVGTSDAGAQAGSLSLYAGASHGIDMNGGGVAITSGDARTGNANGGDILIATGNGVGSGSRGNIILDTSSVLFPGAAGALLLAQTGAAYLTTAGQTGSTASQWAGIGSGDTVDGDGGGAEIYTGNTTGSGDTGPVDLHSGDANGTGSTGNVNLYSGNADCNSGDIHLFTGVVYTASAVHFFDGVNLTSESGFGTPAVFSFSFWFNMPSYDGTPHNQDFSFFKVANHDASDYGAISFTGTDDWTSPGLFNSYWPDPTGTAYLNFGAMTASTGLYNGQWHHVLGVVSGALGLTTIYIDDQLLGLPTYIVGNSWTPPLDLDWQGVMTVSAQVGAGQEFDMADFWCAPGVSLLNGGGTIDEATRRQFISATGQPMNPSGFPSSAVLFSGDSTTFATNQGTGGSFDLNDSLADALTSPSHGRGKIILDAPKISMPGLIPFPIGNSVPRDATFLLNTSDRSWTLSARDLAVALLNQSIYPPPLDANDTTGTQAQNVYLLAGSGTDAQPNPGSVFIYAGTAASSTTGGSLNIASGYSNTGQTGSVNIYSTGSQNGGNSGEVDLYSGIVNNGDGSSGNVNVNSGQTPGAGNSGTVALFTGQCTGSGSSGQITLTTGNVNDAAATTGDIVLQTGLGNGGRTGAISFTTGNAIGSGSSGNIIFVSGSNSGTGASGLIALASGATQASGSGTVSIYSGTNADVNQTGAVGIYSGDNSSSGPSGAVSLGTGSTQAGLPGQVVVYTGNSSAGDSGHITVASGNAASTSGLITIFTGPGNSTGNVYVQTGEASAGNSGGITIATGAASSNRGNITLDALLVLVPNLPTSDPHVVNALWNNGGTLKISAGP